jgi:hypothetical protein
MGCTIEGLILRSQVTVLSAGDGRLSSHEEVFAPVCDVARVAPRLRFTWRDSVPALLGEKDLQGFRNLEGLSCDCAPTRRLPAQEKCAFASLAPQLRFTGRDSVLAPLGEKDLQGFRNLEGP